jgi:23S rRNA (guanine2445-N2)-methyltransferase / 23S rRNA (guanine2069-N7)-methyltransferase
MLIQAERYKSNVEYLYFATLPKGLEELLAAELCELGAHNVKPARAGIALRGPLAVASRACLWARLASRLLLTLARFPVPGRQALYEGVRTIAWHKHLSATGTLAVDFNTVKAAITHTNHGALTAKDAIVDPCREQRSVRPSVATVQPDV